MPVAGHRSDMDLSHLVFIFASSREFVGGFRLGWIAECMIQRHLQLLERTKSLRFSGTHFLLLFNLPTPGKDPSPSPLPQGEGIRFPAFSCHIPLSPGHMLPSFGYLLPSP